MRIVSIAVSAGVPEYENFGGIANFGKTEIVGSECIGEYNGSLGTNDLADYTGAWPLQEYETVLSKTDFKALFTATEFRAISVLITTDDNAFQFWDMSQTADFIDMNDPRTKAGLNYVGGILSEITPARLATIRKGKAV